MLLNYEELNELGADYVADLADALEVESLELADALCEVYDECDKCDVMARIVTLEKILKDVKRYLDDLEMD